MAEEILASPFETKSVMTKDEFELLRNNVLSLLQEYGIRVKLPYPPQDRLTTFLREKLRSNSVSLQLPSPKGQSKIEWQRVFLNQDLFLRFVFQLAQKMYEAGVPITLKSVIDMPHSVGIFIRQQGVHCPITWTRSQRYDDDSQVVRCMLKEAPKLLQTLDPERFEKASVL